MNINLVLMKIKHSDMDDGMKHALGLILDKALEDADTVARLEESIKSNSFEFFTKKDLMVILNGDKPDS